MDSKAQAVLDAAEELFREEEAHEHPPMIGDGPKAIGEKLGLPPAEVLVLLRMLHRKGMIALFSGFGLSATIARDQALLRPPTAVVTDGGRGAKLSKGRRVQGYYEDPEASPPEIEELLAYITQLEATLDETQARADKAEGRRRNISDARRRAEEGKAEAEERLRRAMADNRRLSQQVDQLQTEAAKVPGLEQTIKELRSPRQLPEELAATLARLHQK